MIFVFEYMVRKNWVDNCGFGGGEEWQFNEIKAILSQIACQSSIFTSMKCLSCREISSLLLVCHSYIHCML